MAAGLSPENWALLALCGAALGLASSLVAIEPGFLFMPLLATSLAALRRGRRGDSADRDRNRARAARPGLHRRAEASLPRCAPAPRMAFARHRGGGIFRGEPCASSSRALALRRLRGHGHRRGYAKAGLDRGKARRDAAAPADGPLRRDLEKPRLFPLRRRLASCGSSAGKSRVDAPHGACRSGGSCYRTCGLQGMRGLRLHARALCDGSRLRLDGASLASPVRGKSLSAAASAPCGPGRRRSSSCFAFGHAGNAKGGAGRACARALPGKPFRPARC